MLRDQGEPADSETFRPAKLTSIAYVEHDVQVAALMARIAARAADFVGRTGPLIDATPFELLGPRSGTIDPRVERRAPDASPTSNLAGRRVRLGRAHPGVLKPDATMIGVDRHGNRTAVMFEFDRTRRPSKQAERLQRYDWFLTAGWCEGRYACLDVEPAVLVVCAKERDIRPFVGVADRTLAASYAPRQAITHHWEHSGRAQIGVTSLHRLSTGCAQIVQVAEDPRRRDQGGSATGAPADLRLECLFLAQR